MPSNGDDARMAEVGDEAHLLTRLFEMREVQMRQKMRKRIFTTPIEIETDMMCIFWKPITA